MEQKKIVMEVFSDVPIKIKINFSVILSEIVLRFVSYLFFFFQFYNFTTFAMSLNELEPGMEKKLCPTDCRFRKFSNSLLNSRCLFGIEVTKDFPYFR